MTDVLAGWQEFYAAVAGAGAALVGLVYVGVSIRMGRRPLGSRVRALGAMTSQNLIQPLFVALTMLLPVLSAVQGALLLVLGAAGLANTVGAAYVEARHGGHTRGPMTERRDVGAPRPVRALESWALATSGDENRFLSAYRYVMPVVASLVLMAGAVGLFVGSTLAVYAPPVFVFLMFFVGIENAWALLIDGAADDAPPRHAREVAQHCVEETVRGVTRRAGSARGDSAAQSAP